MTPAAAAAPRFEQPSPLRIPETWSATARAFDDTLAALSAGRTAAPAELALLDADRAADYPSPTPRCRVFPADRWQMRACVQALAAPGNAARDGGALIYAGSTPVPDLTDVNDELLFATGYRFEPGVDDLIREGCDALLISYGDGLHPCLDLVERMLGDGVSLGLVGKPTLDRPDPAMLARLARAPALLLVDALPAAHGLDRRLRDWLDAQGFSGRYAAIGASLDGAARVPTEAQIRRALSTLLGGAARPIGARALTRDGLLAAATRVVEFDAPETVDLPAPKTLAPLDPRLAAKLGPFSFQTPFAAELANCRLVGPQALALTQDGQPILESAANRIDVLGRTLSRIPAALLDAAPVERLALACPLINLWSPLYAHWMLEGLTRLQAWEAYTAATGERPLLIIDRDPPGWMRESLALMGVAVEDCLQWPSAADPAQGAAGPIRVDRLVLCCKRREQGRVSARALAWVRERILEGLPPEPSPHPRRIFITRADSRFRQVVDEDALLAALAPLGFERVRLSALAWPEQVRLFRDVEAVVAAHGAGMTNIMFSTRRPMVVELFGQKVSHMNYTVGLGLGCDHRVLRCPARGDDLLVDNAALRRLIEA